MSENIKYIYEVFKRCEFFRFHLPVIIDDVNNFICSILPLLKNNCSYLNKESEKDELKKMMITDSSSFIIIFERLEELKREIEKNASCYLNLLAAEEKLKKIKKDTEEILTSFVLNSERLVGEINKRKIRIIFRTFRMLEN